MLAPKSMTFGRTSPEAGRRDFLKTAVVGGAAAAGGSAAIVTPETAPS